MPDPAPIKLAPVKVPIGLATQVGYALGVVQIIAAALIPIIDGLPKDASTASIIVALVLGATTVITRVNDGRQKQAAAAYADAPSPAQRDDSSGELDDPSLTEVAHPEPAEEELVEAYPDRQGSPATLGSDDMGGPPSGTPPGLQQ